MIPVYTMLWCFAFHQHVRAAFHISMSHHHCSQDLESGHHVLEMIEVVHVNRLDVLWHQSS